MPSEWAKGLEHLIWGSLLVGQDSNPAPQPSAYESLCLRAVLCDLRPRFLHKCRVGRGYRAVARNGRVLLASDGPVTDLGGRVALVRLQTWHRAILPGDALQPYGLLLCVRTTEAGGEPGYAAQLVRLA